LLWRCDSTQVMASSFLRFFYITHNNAPQSVGLLWTSDQIVVETSTWQHITLTTEKHPCPAVGFEPTISAGERPQTYALDQCTDWNNFKIKLLWHTHIKEHICSWVVCTASVNCYCKNAIVIENNINMSTKSENPSFLRSYLAYLDNISLCRQTSPFIRLYKSSTQTRVTETLKRLPHYKGKFRQFYFFFQLINPLNPELNPICYLLALL